MKTCKAVARDGEHCKSPILKNSDYCYFHDPCCTKSRREAQSRGGKKAARLQLIPHGLTPNFELRQPEGIFDLLQYAVECALQGDGKTAGILGYLADVTLRAHNTAKISAEVAAIKALQKVEHTLPPYQEHGFVNGFDEVGPQETPLESQEGK